MLEMRILEIALIFRNLNEIYFPVRLDFRGRVYPVVDYIR
jgi:DNA-directed RNA polymerase